MKKERFIKKLFSILTAAALLTANPAAVTMAQTDDTNNAAYVVFGKTMENNKAEAIISSNVLDVNYNLFGEHAGRECIITQLKRTEKSRNNGIANIPVKIDDTYISSSDRNIAVSVTFFDRGWDTIHVCYYDSTGKRISHDIVKYASNTWRTATIILRDPMLDNQELCGSDIVINASEAQLLWEEEFISKVQITNLDKTYSDAYAPSKNDILHTTEARALSKLGLFEGFVENGKNGLDAALTREAAIKAVIGTAYGGTEELKGATTTASDVTAAAKPYVGLALQKGIINARSDGSIGANDIITMKELLDMIITAVENSGSKTIDNTAAKALEMNISDEIVGKDEHSITGFPIYNVVPGLWTAELGNLNRYAYKDDLAAACYNLMKLTVNGNTKPVMASLFEKGVFSREAIVTSGCGELIYEFYRQVGFDLVEESYVDADTGITINYLSLPGLPSAGGYAHAMNLSSDGRFVIVGAAIDTSSNYGILVAYDRQTKKSTPLNPELKESYYYAAMIAQETDEVFYTCGKELHCFDLKTMTSRFIVAQKEDAAEDVWCMVPSVTADGNTVVLSGYDKVARTNLTMDIINTRTGEMHQPFGRDTVYTLNSPKGKYTPKNLGHINVNPVYDNLYFYILHYVESTAPYELWVYNEDTNEHKCVYSDHLNPDTGKKDMSTSHWIWSYDGEKLYWIQYTSGDYIPEIGGAGIAWTTKDGNSTYSAEGYISADYSYNHAGVSYGDRYFIGDTTSKWAEDRFESKVSVFDRETGKSRLIANKIGIWVNHPGHVHPLFSKDLSTLSFTMAVDNYHLVAAFVDLTNLPEENYDNYKTAYATYGEKSVEKGVERFFEYPDRAYYSNTDNEIGYIGGKSCLKIDTKHKAPFNVLAHFINAFDETVTFRIEYFDNGSEPIEILYNSNHLEDTPFNRKNRPISFLRTNTNQWQTKEITVKDASFMNAGAGVGDFAISAINSKEPVYIKSIYTSKGTEITEVAVDTSGIEGMETIKAFSDDYASPIAVKGNYKKETSADGGEYIKLTGNNYVGFKIDNSVKKKLGDTVKIAVTYQDIGMGYILFEYNADNKILGVPTSRDYKPYKINRSGKGIWKTEIIELSDAAFEGRQSDGSDFRITSSGSSVPIYIKQVEIITGGKS